MNRTELYADQRMNLKEDTDMRFVSLDRRIEALEESAFEDSRKIDILMDLIESQQKSISFILDVLKPKEEEPEEEAVKLFDENFEHPINMLDELMGVKK